MHPYKNSGRFLALFVTLTVLTGMTPGSAATEHRVAPGETISGIARQYRTPAAGIVQANPLQDPDHIEPGQIVLVPEAPAVQRHVVAPGETLFTIARGYGTTVPKLLLDNGITDPEGLEPGQVLRVSPAVYHHVLYRGPATVPGAAEPQSARRIALTFDDGPSPQHTATILRTLASRGVRATFFISGRQAAAHPGLMQQLAAGGHELGNHTWDHPDLRPLSPGEIGDQIWRSEQEILRHTGEYPALFRAPYGFVNRQSQLAIWERGYNIVHWSVDSLDWQARRKEDVLEKVLAEVHPGAIVLLHDKRHTAAALPELIDALRERGYTLVTVSELLRVPATR